VLFNASNLFFREKDMEQLFIGKEIKFREDISLDGEKVFYSLF